MIKKLSKKIKNCIICGAEFNYSRNEICCSTACSLDNFKKWNNKNRDTILEYKREHSKRNYLKNKDSILEKNAAYQKEYRKVRYNNDTNFMLSCKLREHLNRSLKNKKVGNRTKNFIDYTPNQLREHLESLWLEGMSWDNYGLYGWHIDHKRPIASFNFINDDGSIDKEEVKKCMHLNNLQPLWATDNLSKNAFYKGEL